MRFAVRRKVLLPILGLVVVLAVLSLTGVVVIQPPDWVHRAATVSLPGVLFQVDTDSLVVALTIDDAPSSEVTPGILAVLRRHGARATFFVIGSHAEAHPDLVEAIRAEGHELGNHLFFDRPSIQLDDEEFVRMLHRTDALIRPAGPQKWCRPASGWIDDGMVELLHQNDYRACLASVYPLDLAAPRWLTVWQFTANVQPGAILVLHDGGAGRVQTVGILDEVLPLLRAKGYRVVTVSELVGMGE